MEKTVRNDMCSARWMHAAPRRSWTMARYRFQAQGVEVRFLVSELQSPKGPWIDFKTSALIVPISNGRARGPQSCGNRPTLLGTHAHSKHCAVQELNMQDCVQRRPATWIFYFQCSMFKMPPWPNGQGVGLLIRRLRVRVPQGVFCFVGFAVGWQRLFFNFG